MKKNSFIFTLIAACLVLFAACSNQNTAEQRALFVGDYDAVLNGSITLKGMLPGQTKELPIDSLTGSFSIIPDGEGNKVKLCAFDTTITATVKSATLMLLDSTTFVVSAMGADVKAQLLSDKVNRNADTLIYTTDVEASVDFNGKSFTATGNGTLVAVKKKVAADK